MKPEKIILILIITLSIILSTCFWRPLSRPFREKERLNYQDATYIEILFNIDEHENGWVKIDNKEGVKRLINYLNSLEIIEEESSDGTRESWCFIIYIYGEQSDSISFYDKYLSITPAEKCDCFFTEYYIADSGYNPKDGSSKTLHFLDNLISDYAES
ncbi:MAG TPA: hypothetical protein GX710_04685 [Clostridiales bacterium]|nr:hypothetical protein [Clostridiales bacterium]